MISALLILGYAYALWLLFLAVMALQWRWRELTKPVRMLASHAVVVAVLLDVLFLDLPRQLTFSQRIGAYKRRTAVLLDL